ncbi:uncharacterized protein LOC121963063 [Plectropomus leopardus]|uniref:uncharacterized protein LOC121963063 n=1 Tax=Plectropomus leopardus TaxID=160734 RepID=UPI001C4C60D1|nr:uncharacterized protein LOC121963063 [Plectropomus leopardus]
MRTETDSTHTFSRSETSERAAHHTPPPAEHHLPGGPPNVQTLSNSLLPGSAMANPSTLLFLLAGEQPFKVFSTLADRFPTRGHRPLLWVDRMSYPGSSAVLCFKNDPSETAKDCLFVEDNGGADRVAATLQDKFTLRFYNFGPQTGLMVGGYSDYTPVNFVLNAKVGDSSLGSWSWTNAELLNNQFIDLSGCRYSGVSIAAGSETFSSETCSQVTCNKSAVISVVSTCGPLEVCQGNGTCVPTPVVCTVTGSTVIDFFNRVRSVSDRCAYTLMKPQRGSGYELVAVFKERRRKDVGFLDHLILSHGGKKIFLGQGGRVRVSGETLTLSTEFQTLHGVELLKDENGVTAKIPSSNMKVVFDGNTAHVTGLVEAVEGLCGFTTDSSRTTTPRAEKSSSYSADGCDVQHSDTNDTSISCNRSTEHCGLMKQGPFTACHNDTDPQPYITACTDTLCHYPQVDGLKCQFFEAYAKSCKLKNNIILQDWRSTVGCSAAPLPCRDLYCSEDEFCGEKPGGTRCFCRALFAAKYKEKDTLGEPTVCTQNSATAALANCLLEDEGIDYTDLHLRDPSCQSQLDHETHMVSFSFDISNLCRTEVTMKDDKIIYKNTIMTRNTSTHFISRHVHAEIDFFCVYTQPAIKSVIFKISDNSVSEMIVSVQWNYTVMMNAYTDSDRLTLIGPDTEIHLNQRVWLELTTDGLDNSMVAVVTDSCWATNQMSPYADLRYNLIINGCPDDSTVQVEGNGAGTSNAFSFNMFRFAAGNHDIYLHCELELCLTQEDTCTKTCGGGARRRRTSVRSKYADRNSALITLAWNY